MARKKKVEEAAVSEEKKGKPTITLETIETVFMRAIEDPQRGVPALIGPPQWGKTHYIREWMLKTGADEIVMVNPQTDTPEDVGGWPVRTRGELTFTQPAPIPPHLLKRSAPKWAMFIDELDKAQDETLSAMLTLLNPGERRLRRTYLPEDVPLAVAMNEPRRELPEPLIARLLFIPFPPAGFQMSPPVASSNTLSPPVVTVPKRPHAPGSYFKLKKWFSVPEFQSDEAVQLAVVSGLFPAEVVPAVLDSFQGNLNRAEHWAETCTVPELLKGVLFVMASQPDAESVRNIINILQKRADEDEVGEFNQALLYVMAKRPELSEWIFDPGNMDLDKWRQLGDTIVSEYKRDVLEADGE